MKKDGIKEKGWILVGGRMEGNKKRDKITNRKKRRKISMKKRKK